ncbi:ribonuclease P protein component [Patescibacteria group bacterium]|nr:ribonuclease P protein component [Patescibacteria group bacterium]
MFVFVKKKKEGGKSIIAVGKSVSKKATERNLIKRRIRAVLRSAKNSPASLFVVAKPGVLSLNFNELKKEIENQINELTK